MTATVTSLSSRRRRPDAAASCPCRPEWECFSHRVLRAADLLRTHLAVTDGELLIARENAAQTTADVLALLDGVAAETLGPEGRGVR